MSILWDKQTLNDREQAEYDMYRQGIIQSEIDSYDWMIAHTESRRRKREQEADALLKVLVWMGVFFVSGFVLYWVLLFFGHLFQMVGVRITGLFQ